MSSITSMPANRVAALVSFATALGALIAAFVGVFPAGWQNTVLALAAVLSHVPTVITFLRGSQKWDELQAKKQLQTGGAQFFGSTSGVAGTAATGSAPQFSITTAGQAEESMFGAVSDQEEFADSPLKLDPPSADGGLPRKDVPTGNGPEIASAEPKS